MADFDKARQYRQPHYTIPSPAAPVNFQREIYSSLRSPKYSTKPSEWEAAARRIVPAQNFGYVHGSAGTGQTHLSNLASFTHYRLRPHMLVNATVRDISVTLFGKHYPSPLLVAPVGVQAIMHRDAELATARACANVRVPMILSTAATRSIEEVAGAMDSAASATAEAKGEEGTTDRWYQLYWPRPQNEEITASLLSRAKKAGYSVLVVTLDTFMLGWRPTDLDSAYLPFIWGEGCQVGLSDPVFEKVYEEEMAKDQRTKGEKIREAVGIMLRPGTPWGALKVLRYKEAIKKSQLWMAILNSGTYRKWEHLQTLKKLWDGPIVLKGIQTVDDAHRAIDAGMVGIVVSNHGGRQLDGAIASLDALAEIAADARVKKSGLTVLFDSGIRTGSDVLKALALGAKAVLIGRPYMYGLAMGGQQGVEHVLRCLLADTDNMLGNMGKTSLGELSRNDLQMPRQSKL